MNEIITESEQIELGAADMLLVEITDRMKANGKSEIVFTDPKTKRPRQKPNSTFT